MMVYDVYSGGNNFIQGFTVFSLGTILFFLITSAYMITRILTNTNIIADVLEKFVENEIAKTKNNPLQNFPGIIQISKIDEQGNISPVSDSTNSNPDFSRMHSEIINNLFKKPFATKKELEVMTLEELNKEKEEAIEKQDYERAARIRNIIDEKFK